MNHTYKNTYNLWGLFSHLEGLEEADQSKVLTVIIAILKIDPCVDFDFKAIETIMNKSKNVTVRTKAFNALALVGYFEDDNQPDLPFDMEAEAVKPAVPVEVAAIEHVTQDYQGEPVQVGDTITFGDAVDRQSAVVSAVNGCATVDIDGVAVYVADLDRVLVMQKADGRRRTVCQAPGTGTGYCAYFETGQFDFCDLDRQTCSGTDDDRFGCHYMGFAPAEDEVLHSPYGPEDECVCSPDDADPDDVLYSPDDLDAEGYKRSFCVRRKLACPFYGRLSDKNDVCTHYGTKVIGCGYMRFSSPEETVPPAEVVEGLGGAGTGVSGKKRKAVSHE